MSIAIDLLWIHLYRKTFECCSVICRNLDIRVDKIEQLKQTVLEDKRVEELVS